MEKKNIKVRDLKPNKDAKGGHAGTNKTGINHAGVNRGTTNTHSPNSTRPNTSGSSVH